jgi:hypothetical protein
MERLPRDELIQIFELDDEVIDVEISENGTVFPVVRVYDDGAQLQHWCIHCRKWHFHGRGDKDEPYEAGPAGHVTSHCTTINSPFHQTGLILYVVGEFDENVRKMHRKGTALLCPKCKSHYSAAFNACNCGSRFVNKKRKPEYPAIAELYKKILLALSP